MEHLSIAAQTAYAEALQTVMAAPLFDNQVVGRPGSFVTKQIKGRDYWYFQYRSANKQQQLYIGPDSPQVQAIVGLGLDELDDLRQSQSLTTKLIATARAAGGTAHTAAEAEVIAHLATGDLFRSGAVMVGSTAFACLGNMLGVALSGDLYRTEDIDIVSDPDIMIALPRAQRLPTTGDGPLFVGVPELNRKHPSTSFRVRGTTLRVDLLTPLVGKPTGTPVELPGLGAWAHPLRFLDYLIEDAQPALILSGAGVLVQVPHPARFAVHKLLVANERPAAFATKSAKDIPQASVLIEALASDRPFDLAAAWSSAIARGPGWRKRIVAGAKRLPQPIQQWLKEAVS